MTSGPTYIKLIGFGTVRLRLLSPLKLIQCRSPAWYSLGIVPLLLQVELTTTLRYLWPDPLQLVRRALEILSKVSLWADV